VMYMKLCASREQPSTGLLMWVNELGGVVTEVSEEGKATDARLMIFTSLCIDRLVHRWISAYGSSKALVGVLLAELQLEQPNLG